jgi:hypothetical protein
MVNNEGAEQQHRYDVNSPEHRAHLSAPHRGRCCPDSAMTMYRELTATSPGENVVGKFTIHSKY